MDILDEFFLEANEMLSEAEDSFLEIEKIENLEEEFNKIFRIFHSLKGSAGMMGLEQLQRHMHLMEDSLSVETIRDKVDYYLKGIDVSKQLIAGDDNVTFFKC
jgi:chemotaxis protein histidine kinase CheA